MKILITLLLVIIYLPFFSQNCKPNLSSTDKISKEANIAWESTIFETSFWGNMLSSTDWDLRLQFGRYGNSNLLSLFLVRREASQQKVNYESQYKGEKDRDFYLAFSNGDALKFTIQNTNTQSKIDPIDGKFVTVITMTTILSNKLISELKSRFDTGLLTAARISLAGNINFEKTVNEKKGKESKEKFYCFWDYNLKNPTKISQAFRDLYALKENPAGISIPESLPVNQNTQKISFGEVVEINGTSKEILFDRAKKWATLYFKNDKFSILNKEEGQIVKTEYFEAEYPAVGKVNREKHQFSLSIWLKEGKYKYEITDISDSGNDSNKSIEEAYESAKKVIENEEQYLIWKKYVDQQIYLGTYEIISALKKAMVEDLKNDSDW